MLIERYGSATPFSINMFCLPLFIIWCSFECLCQNDTYEYGRCVDVRRIRASPVCSGSVPLNRLSITT